MRLLFVTLLMFAPFASQAQEQQAMADGQEHVIGVGLTLERVQNAFVVQAIVQGSPAEKDGTITAGDILLAVQQDLPGAPWIPVNGMQLPNVVAMIRGPQGTKVGLHLSHNGSEYSVQLTREPLNVN